jgi:putative endopeptidase
VISDEQKLGDYYTACMDEASIEKAGFTPLLPDLKAIDGLKNVRDFPRVLAFLHSTGTNVLFNFGSQPDAQDSSRIVAGVFQSGLGLPDRDFYLKADEKSETTRKEYLQHIGRMLKLLGDQDETAADRIFALEKAMATAMMERTKLRDPKATNHPMAVAEFAKLMPAFNWASYWKLRQTPALTQVNAGQPEYLKALNQLLTSVPIADFRTYLRWHAVRGAAPFMTKAFADEAFSFTKVLTGAKEQLPRWRRCVQATDEQLGEALGRKFVEKHYPAKAKQRMNELIDNLFAVLREDLTAADWMSNSTRAQALAKLDSFKRKVGHTEKWRDYSTVKIARKSYFANSLETSRFEVRRDLKKIGQPVDRGEWLMTPPEVNAYYHSRNIEIVFPAGILQPPFFDFEADDAINYGGIGAVIGHEIIHGFDDNGRQFDAQGNLRDWWTAEDGKKYQERANCVENQFSSFKVQDGLNVNGKLVLGESIADLGGLRLSYRAFQKSLQGKPKPEKVDGFTPEQRFFLGWAQVWASNYRAEYERMTTLTDPHPLPRFRVNGPLSNLPEFRRAFGCQSSDPMVRKEGDRCRVW